MCKTAVETYIGSVLENAEVIYDYDNNIWRYGKTPPEEFTSESISVVQTGSSSFTVTVSPDSGLDRHLFTVNFNPVDKDTKYCFGFVDIVCSRD